MDPPPIIYDTPRSSPPSWPFLLTLTAIIFTTAALMARNVWYTGGENIELLHMAATGLTLLCALVGFYNRHLATWLVLLIGGTLILGQAWQTRRWATLQEEVIAMIDYAKREKTKTGTYPPNLDGYIYRHPETQSHIYYNLREGKLMLTYFLNTPGDDTFWYREDDGFLYNGD